MSDFWQFIGKVPPEALFATLVFVVIVSLLRGWLLPRSHLVDLRADFASRQAASQSEIKALREDRDKRILELREDRDKRVAEVMEEAQAWREAYLANEAALAVVRSQNGELLEVARTIESLFQPGPAGPFADHGGGDRA